MRAQYTVQTPIVAQLRDRQRQFLRVNQRFPECIDVGIRVWEQMQDWHIKHLRPLTIHRAGDGRWQMDFIMSVLVLKPEMQRQRSRSRRMTANTSADAQLVRAIGTRELTLSIINVTIASSIFLMPATVAERLGAAAPIAYLVCAALMTLIALCFAAAGSRVSLTGGLYAYIDTAFGGFRGFPRRLSCIPSRRVCRSHRSPPHLRGPPACSGRRSRPVRLARCCWRCCSRRWLR